MSTGYSIHLGVNFLDKDHYPDAPELRVATADAWDWASIARTVFGYGEQVVLLNEQATAATLLEYLTNKAGILKDGDILLITYSGHGAQIEDAFSTILGDEPEDQTWCLYDRQLIDDELYAAFGQFEKGVRIAVIADCCHSGSSTRDANTGKTAEELSALLRKQSMQAELQAAGLLPRKLPMAIAARVYAQNARLYQSVLENIPPQTTVQASVKLFAACQDNELTYDGDNNGIFTDSLKKLIQSDAWKTVSSPEDLLQKLRLNCPYTTPNYFYYGECIPEFEQGFPLKVSLIR